MRGARPLAAALSAITALVTALAAFGAIAPGNRTALLFPDLLVVTLLAAASTALQLTRRRWPALATAAAGLVLLAWLPSSAHWTETAIKQAAGPCPPFSICKLQPPLSAAEAAALQWLTALSLAALLPATLATGAGILALPDTSCRPQPLSLAAFPIAALLAGAAALSPWLAGGPPFGFDDRAAFFTVFAELAALAAFLALLAGAHGRPMLSSALGAAAAALLVTTVAGLPFTDWFIYTFGQPQSCSGFFCPPAFNHVEERARLLMIAFATPAALLSTAGAAIDARYRYLVGVPGQRVEHPV